MFFFLQQQELILKSDTQKRTQKVILFNANQWLNGRLESVNFNMRNAMFYPNSYINFNNDGYYTKHYYNGMERIASRLGDQGFGMEQPTDGDLLSRKNDLGKVFVEQFQEMLGNQDSIKLHDTLQLRDLQPNPAGGLYFYHPNHLGSTCYVTDENASVVQGFLYAPFGEITNEYNAGWQSGTLPKYSFNAKELDEETGMYYYEARYMAPPVFISRDRLFEKYPFMSPYGYCMNNPIKYIDPSGDSVKFAGNKEEECYNNYKSEVSNRRAGWQSKISKYQASLSTAKTKIGKIVYNNRLNQAKKNFELYDGIQNELNSMENSSIVFRIRMGNNIQADVQDASGSTTYNINNKEVDINLYDNDIQSIAHELLHGYQYLIGDLDFDASGLNGGYFYDKTDEFAAFERENLFAKYEIEPSKMVDKYYSSLSEEPKSYNRLKPIEKSQYNREKEKGTYR